MPLTSFSEKLKAKSSEASGKLKAKTSEASDKLKGKTYDASDMLKGRTERMFSPRKDENQEESDVFTSSKDAVCLEASMTLKYAKSTGKSTKWFKAYVVLDMKDGGTFKYYASKPKKTPSAAQFNARRSTRILGGFSGDVEMEPLLEIPPHINWVAKDFEYSSRRFVIEIPNEGAIVRQSFDNIGTVDYTSTGSNESNEDQIYPHELEVDGDEDFAGDTDSGFFSDINEDISKDVEAVRVPAVLEKAIYFAKSKNEPFRLHVQCLRRGGKEKALWMKGFEDLGRMSFKIHKTNNLIMKKVFSKSSIHRERTRTQKDDKFASYEKSLSDIFAKQTSDEEQDTVDSQTTTDFRICRRSTVKEYLVEPTYAYPNRWMTDSELYQEMLKPSEVFHDLRLSSEKQTEIGTCRVEVLECSGLPQLDWASETDGVVYLVCGSYAFTTDVIDNKSNPVWLPRSRRACIFPLFHAYAKVFAGVFDDDGKGHNDDFAGRVVLDLARCRPGSTYDVALPLRLSQHIYSRRKRGVLRLRFSVEYTSERAALLSYLPKNPRGFTTRPNDDVTIICHDEKAFRNITLTVHGQHFPGKFTVSLMNATIREVDFLRKLVVRTIENRVTDIIFWKNPSLSVLLFACWVFNVLNRSLSYIPGQLVLFFILVMIENYAFYGTDGRVNQGFVPPSFEEMASALLAFPGKNGKAIKPLHVKPHRDERGALEAGETFKTHEPRGKKLFKILGFPDTTEEDRAEDYHVELQLSRGLQHPITGEYQYPRFSVQDAREKKQKKGFKAKTTTDFDDSQGIFGELLKSGVVVKEAVSDAVMEGVSEFVTQVSEKTDKVNVTEKGKAVEEAYLALPADMRISLQDIDANNVSLKTKTVDEFYEIRDIIHELTFHLFHDKTYAVAHEDAMWFGGKPSKHIKTDLDRLLGSGQFANSNPVISMIGVHLEPMLQAARSFLCAIRQIINILTWQDPILSFWVTLGLIASGLVLLIFPFRLFFLALGLVILGPQNYIFITFINPSFLENLKSKKEAKRQAKKARVAKEKFTGIPENQPIISCHTSDNSQPISLTFSDVDKKALHQVCVPYSQLTYRRDNYWPPQPEYGKCDPDVRSFLKSMKKLEKLEARSGSLGCAKNRAPS